MIAETLDIGHVCSFVVRKSGVCHRSFIIAYEMTSLSAPPHRIIVDNVPAWVPKAAVSFPHDFDSVSDSSYAL